MTDTLTPTDTSADPVAATDQTLSRTHDETPPRECIDVDPTTLIIGDNVRAAAHLDRQFLASLREHGVMNPIQAVRADDGTLTVKRGQRRTLGAVKAGLATVPVLVVSEDTDEADRIVKQWHENERRDALTETDRLAAVEQLTILGVPAGNIARRLGTPKKQVEAAVAANGSETAKAAARKHSLTLTDAALVAEFEDDEETVKDILRAVRDGDSAEHVAQRARDEKARQQVLAEAVGELVEAGVTVIDRPNYDDKTIKELREIRLLNKDGSAKKKAPTEAEHAACPGHAAYVASGYSGLHTTYVCTDPKSNKHALYSWNGETRLPGQQSSGGGMTEQQKADRRTLVANNKSWDSSTVVRRAWLAESFLTRTTPPKGAETFLAVAVAHGEHTETSHETYADLTRTADDKNKPSFQRYWGVTTAVEAKAVAAAPRQAIMLAVALLVCEWESTLTRENWRRPQPRDRRYLTALIGWGYKPSDVERLILAPTETVEQTTEQTQQTSDAPSEAETEAAAIQPDADVASDDDTDSAAPEMVEDDPDDQTVEDEQPVRATTACEQCGGTGAGHETEYGLLCDGCANRQSEHDERRESFAHLTPTSLGFDRYDDDGHED